MLNVLDLTTLKNRINTVAGYFKNGAVFDKDVTVKGNIHGKADKAVRADSAATVSAKASEGTSDILSGANASGQTVFRMTMANEQINIDSLDAINVKKYKNSFQEDGQELSLLDENGDTHFPGTIHAEKLQGTASQAIADRNGDNIDQTYAKLGTVSINDIATDWNTLTDITSYSIEQPAHLCKNAPEESTADAGTLVVSGHDKGSGRLVQTFYGRKLGILTDTFVRNGTVSGSWSDWHKVAFAEDNIASASKLASARNITLTGKAEGQASFDGTKDISINVSNVTADQCFGNSATATKTEASIEEGKEKDLLHGSYAGADLVRIHAGGSGQNSWAELATASNGNKPVYIRQYTSDKDNGFAKVSRTATILDANGNSSFPGTISANTFNGRLQGNALTASDITTGYLNDSITATKEGIAGIRSTLFGSTNNGYHVRPFRTLLPDNTQGYAAGLAWSTLDTHSFVQEDYQTPSVVFGAGNNNQINWWLKLNGTSKKAYNLDNMPNAQNADKLGGILADSYLRYRDAISSTDKAPQELWDQIGIRQFNHTIPKDMQANGTDYGAVVTLPGIQSRLAVWAGFDSKTNKETLYYRTGWEDAKGVWKKILSEDDHIASATKAQQDANGLTLLGVQNGAGAHNSMYRGIDITEDFDSGRFSESVASGSFDNIYPGDYIIKDVTIGGTTYSDVKWIVGDLDYFYGTGDKKCQQHHVVMFPEIGLGYSKMNESNTTTTGFANSYLFKTVLGKVEQGIAGAFEASHLIDHRELLSKNASTEGVSNSNDWFSMTASLFTEPMVYGTTIYGSSGMDVGIENQQLAAFRSNHSLQRIRMDAYWLRAVADKANYCQVSEYGAASTRMASASAAIRPFFLLS